MKPFQPILLCLFLMSPLALWAQASKPEVIAGCQGEGCDCFRAYSQSPKHDFDIPGIRPFKLYERADESSKLLGQFKAGTKGRPHKQMMLVTDPGEYVVERNPGKLSGAKIGDRVSTLISLGEGEMQAKIKGVWINFDSEQLKLKPIRPTKIQQWMEISVGQIQGFSREYPFENCLE